jgi:DNA-binding CsgD family transcriptional regulator
MDADQEPDGGAKAHPPSHNVIEPLAAVRPLPDQTLLSPEDHRRLIGVLEAVDRAPDLPAFRERLLRALQVWFGYGTIAVLHGATLASAMLDGDGVKSGYSAEFLAEYAARWIDADPFLTATARRMLAERGVVTLDDLRPWAVPAQREYVERFLRPHGITNKVGVVVDGSPHGFVYIGAVVREYDRVPARDVAVLHSLRRHLAPLVAGQLASHQVATGNQAWRLTPREREVAALAAQGLTNQQIAARLFVGLDTVKKHLTRVLTETGCASRTQLALRWQRQATLD